MSIGISLGLSEEEFWRSTFAKIAALYNVQVLEWQRRRDYFTAKMAALKLNSFRRQASDKVWSAEDVLLEKYPRRKAPHHLEDDGTDHGAQGDWKALRAYLKGGGKRRRRGRARS